MNIIKKYGEETKAVNFKLPYSIIKQLNDYSVRRDISKTEIIVNLVKDKLTYDDDNEEIEKEKDPFDKMDKFFSFRYTMPRLILILMLVLPYIHIYENSDTGYKRELDSKIKKYETKIKEYNQKIKVAETIYDVELSKEFNEFDLYVKVGKKKGGLNNDIVTLLIRHFFKITLLKAYKELIKRVE